MKRNIVFKIAGYITTAIVILLFGYYLFEKWMFSKFLHRVAGQNEAASIGIIGGADGPTAIYLTVKPMDKLQIAGSIAVGVVILILVFVLIKRHLKKHIN